MADQTQTVLQGQFLPGYQEKYLKDLLANVSSISEKSPLFVDTEEKDVSTQGTDDAENGELGADVEVEADAEADDDEQDALITETARILADAINLRGPIMARIDTP